MDTKFKVVMKDKHLGSVIVDAESFELEDEVFYFYAEEASAESHSVAAAFPRENVNYITVVEVE